MVKAKLLKSSVCECGHDKPTHGTGLAMYGSHDFACAMMGCGCEVFVEAPRTPPKPRNPVGKTLDSTEPKLFDLAL